VGVIYDSILGRLRSDKGQPGEQGAVGPGVPAGGMTGQVLKKASEDDYDSEWANEAAGVSSQFLAVWFAAVAEGTTGSLSAPAGGTLAADQWPEGVDALATELDAAGRPTWTTPREADGSLVTATLNVATGAWELSGTPASYPVGVVFAYTIAVADFDSDYALLGPDYLGDEPQTAVSTAADGDKFVVWQGGALKYVLRSTLAALFEAAGAIATHAGLTTGVHGVGAGTVAKTTDIPAAYGSNPAALGTAAPGESGAWAKGDHVHPTTGVQLVESVAALPASPVAGTVCLLSANDTTAGACAGVWRWSGAYWFQVDGGIYAKGNVGATYTVPDLYEQWTSITLTEALTITLPTARAGKTVVLSITNASAYAITWPAGTLWDGGEPPTLAGLVRLVLVCDDGSHWTVQLGAGGIA